MHINISEVIMILLVALLVIKPEKWPAVAYKSGRLLQWMQQLIAKCKQEMEASLTNNLTMKNNQNKLPQDHHESNS